MDIINQKEKVSVFDQQILIKLRENICQLLYDGSKKFDEVGKKILDIAPQDHIGAKKYFKHASLFTLDINPNSSADFIADLCVCNSQIIEGNYFDVVICTEVLEHTLNPFDAVNEIYRILKDGGVGLISTPYNFRIHGPLPDCWRFTEYGLKELFKKFYKIDIQAHETEDRFLMPYQYTTIVIK